MLRTILTLVLVVAALFLALTPRGLALLGANRPVLVAALVVLGVSQAYRLVSARQAPKTRLCAEEDSETAAWNLRELPASPSASHRTSPTFPATCHFLPWVRLVAPPYHVAGSPAPPNLHFRIRSILKEWMHRPAWRALAAYPKSPLRSYGF